MRNLWVFGDSYSCDWDKVVAKGHKEYVEKYNPISHFSNIIKDTYQFDKVYNISESGNCNYSILESTVPQFSITSPKYGLYTFSSLEIQ